MTASRHLLTRLARLHRRARARVGGLGGAQAMAWTALVLMFAALGTGWTEGEHPVWTVMVLVAAACVIAAVWFDRVVAPWRSLGDRRRFGRDLDRAGGHRNLLVAASESEEQPDRWTGDDVGNALSERLAEAAAPRLDAADPSSDLGLPRIPSSLGLALGVIGLAVLPLLVVSDPVRTGTDRLLHPLGTATWTPSVGLYLEPGPDHAVAGEAVELTAVDFGTPRTAAVCEVREVHGGWRTLAVVADTLPPGSPLIRYRVRVEGLAEDIVYRFRRDGMVTEDAQIRVHHPPLFTALAVDVSPPAYTGLPTRTWNPWPARLEAPAGSTIHWRGTASHDVVAAGFVAGDDTLAWETDGTTVHGSVRLIGELLGSARLRDAYGLDNPDPVERRIVAVPDEVPALWLTARNGEDGRLPPDGRLVLDLLAEDDYGVAAVTLLLRRDSPGGLVDTSWVRLGIPADDAPRSHDHPGFAATLATLEREGADGAPRVARVMELDASLVDLMPGDALEVAAEARDNRRPAPSGRTRSRVLRFVVPSASDLLAEQFETADERQDDLADLRDRGERMAEELERIEREMKRNAELDFARRQELEDAVARQQALQEELSDLGEQMRDDLNTLAEHNLADPQLLEKMERVAELLQDVRSEELERLQEQLREAMEELSEQDVRNAMEQITEQQEEYLERLDRAIALLEDMRREQEMAGLAARTEEMMRRQEELAAEGDQAAEQNQGDASESGDESDSDAAERQDALADEMAALREQIEEARDRLAAEQEAGEESPAAEAMREALEEALEQMEEQGAEQSMRQASEQIQQDGPTPESSESQHESMRRMAALYHVLMQGQQSMQMAMEEYMGDALRRLASDLLDLSRRQEALAATIPSDLRDMRVPTLPRDQKRLLRGVVDLRERMSELLDKSPTMSFQLMQGFDRIIASLDTALGHLEASWGQPASTAARDGLGAMNRMVMNLLTSAQSQGGGGGGGMPMPSLGQQLEQMAREQAGLNGLADQLNRQLQQQGPSQEARAQMQRLQGDQQGMAGRLSEAAEESRDTPDAERLLGDLEELARDMERVSDSLARGEIDEEVLRRQERILGRLLDARNSVRRRDYDKRRESRSADDLLRAQIGDGPDDDGEAERERRRRRREQVEHVPPDYRDLVRRYFRSLTEEPRPEGGRP